MCTPIAPLAIAAVAISAATAATSVVSQVQTAKAQGRAINAANLLRQQQIDEAASAQINDRLRASRRERSRIKVAAGEAGLSLDSGNVETMLMDSYMQAELADDRSLANREAQRSASQAEAISAASNVAAPTLLGAGLQIGLAGASTYVRNKTRAG